MNCDLARWKVIQVGDEKPVVNFAWPFTYWIKCYQESIIILDSCCYLYCNIHPSVYYFQQGPGLHSNCLCTCTLTCMNTHTHEHAHICKSKAFGCCYLSQMKVWAVGICFPGWVNCFPSWHQVTRCQHGSIGAMWVKLIAQGNNNTTPIWHNITRYRTLITRFSDALTTWLCTHTHTHTNFFTGILFVLVPTSIIHVMLTNVE